MSSLLIKPIVQHHRSRVSPIQLRDFPLQQWGNLTVKDPTQQKCRKERVGSVAANPDNLESDKEAGGGAQGTQGSSENCTSRESVSPLSRLIRGFRNKYH